MRVIEKKEYEEKVVIVKKERDCIKSELNKILDSPGYDAIEELKQKINNEKIEIQKLIESLNSLNSLKKEIINIERKKVPELEKKLLQLKQEDFEIWKNSDSTDKEKLTVSITSGKVAQELWDIIEELDKMNEMFIFLQEEQSKLEEFYSYISEMDMYEKTLKALKVENSIVTTSNIKEENKLSEAELVMKELEDKFSFDEDGELELEFEEGIENEVLDPAEIFEEVSKPKKKRFFW